MRFVTMALAALLLAGCNEDKTASAPRPQEPTEDAVSFFCGMGVLEHAGPKGQIFLEGKPAPLWFSSARDTVAFTRLPEEPKSITAIYVSDMGREGWDQLTPGAWVDARKAWYVIGSKRAGGMGATETVPFREKAAADGFAQRYGGRVVAFKEIPDDAILGGDAADPPAQTSALPPASEGGVKHQHGTEP
jgi:copper chaperone NosL